MPFPIAAGIAAGASLVGGAIDAFTTGGQNKKSRQFSEQMYQRQYDDNLKLWRTQNEYNSPQSQMKRLQEAGLNPNLVYGSGAAQTPAGNISTPDVQTPQFRTPEIGNAVADAGSKLMQYQDIQIKQAQIDNLKVQNQVLAEDVLLKRSQGQANLVGMERGIFDLNYKKEMKGNQADYDRQRLVQLKANTAFTLSENERKRVSNISSLKLQAEQILQIRAQTSKSAIERQQILQVIQNLKTDNRLKQKEMEMRAIGISPNSPTWMYILGTTINELFKRY